MENINTNVNLTKIEELLEKLFDFGIQLVISILILFVKCLYTFIGPVSFQCTKPWAHIS